MFPPQRRPEPGLLRRGPKADEAPLADDDRAPAAAEQTQQSIEMHPTLIGGDPDSEIEQHGIQRSLPRLRAPRPVNVRLAKLGIAGSAARLRINDPAGEQRDDGAARPASVVQPAAMHGADNNMGETPAPAERRPRIALQTPRAILQHRPWPAQTIRSAAGQQEPAVPEQGILHEAGSRLLRRCRGYRQHSS